MKKFLILIGLLLLADCTYPMAGPQRIKFKGAKIFQGQSNDSVEKALGAPDIVSEGLRIKNQWVGGFAVTPGYLTIEWVYLGDQHSLIIWLDRGIVRRICVVPTSKVKH